jgi:acyl dehydratase
MALDLSRVGLPTEPTAFTYASKDVALYALGIGAKRDELDYVYEGRGPKVLPSFAVIPSFPAVIRATDRAGVSIEKVVHGHQKVTLHAPIAPEGTLSTTATIAAIYDMKRMAQVVVHTETRDAAGTHLFDTEWGIIVLGEGGFNGEPPPGREGSAPSRPADVRVEEKTTPEQALLYRLSGDLNPLHADPDFSLVRERFNGTPILHGLCSYGFMTRALVRTLCNGDASRLRSVSARFTKPVWPGDTLVTEAWLEGATVYVRSTTLERGEAVLSHGRASISP